MPGHLTPQAKAIADAIKAGADLESQADELLTEIGPIQRPVAIDIGSQLWLVCMPGYGPLDKASAFVHVADQVA